MIDISELSEQERWEYCYSMLRAGKGPRSGRPKKNSDIPTWRDFGFTRKQVWRMRRFAEIPGAEFQALLDQNLASGKRTSYRGILVRFGKITVPSENDYDGTPIGDLARSMLAGCERVLNLPDGPNQVQRRLLKRALQARLQKIFRITDTNPEETTMPTNMARA